MSPLAHSVVLDKRESGGGQVQAPRAGSWHCSIPAGPDRVYRWAQLDDYLACKRADFLWRPPLRLELNAQVSAAGLNGTWGFGLWNDPFSLSFGLGGMSRRLPALPNTVWFFHASPPNYLSFRSDLPAQGFLAATFRSPAIPSALLAVGLPGLPLLLWRPSARLARGAAARLIRQDAAFLGHDPTAWHCYRIDWLPDRAVFFVDAEPVFETCVSPVGPLGLVLWIDNQYAAFTPQGRVAFGTLANPTESWLALDEISVMSL